MDLDVFLSHSSRDAAAARVLRGALHDAGLTTWLAPDDVATARPWAEQIAAAVGRARLLIVLVSESANASDHVAREVALAVRRRAPILPVRIEDCRTDGALDYLLQLAQRYDAWPEGIEHHGATIAGRAVRLLGGAGSRQPAETPGWAAVVVASPPPTAGPVARRVRKTLSVLSASVRPEASASGKLDPEALSLIGERLVAAALSIVDRHEGMVEAATADTITAVFGLPVVHEDDALRAIRAANELRAALPAMRSKLPPPLAAEIEFRAGVSTGEVLAVASRPDGARLTGEALAQASRLRDAAGPGGILVHRSTQRLVRDAITVMERYPEATAVPPDAFLLASVLDGTTGHARRLDTPLVGRARELAALQGAYRQVADGRSSHLFTLLGTAGVGKSRLVAEFLASVQDEAAILRGRCLSYGEGITYWPLRQIVHAAAGVDEGEPAERVLSGIRQALERDRDADLIVERIAIAVGLSDAAAPQEELFWAARRLLEHLARERPLIVVIEDIHWAEMVLLDLLEQIADLARDVPLFLVCPARPDLVERRPTWGGGKLNATTTLLEALPTEASAQLIDALPGGTALPGSLRKRILTAAEGNPLYVEEMLGMLIDEGFLTEGDGSWTVAGDVDSVAVPPTVQALLAARLDQLPAQELAVAERASVIGRVFEQAAVRELAPESLRPGVADALVALVRKELVRPDRSDVAAGDAFKFRHLLIRDAAYAALPKADRADLHERFADWLNRVAGDRASEYSEIVGYHLEQAHGYRLGLGERGTRVDGLAARAGELLAGSGERALGRGDAAAAAELLRRGTSLLTGGTRWAEAMTLLGSADYLRGDVPSALAVLDAVISRSDEIGERLEWRARVVRANIAFYGGEPTDPAIATRAIEILGRVGDADGLASAWMLRATFLGEAGDPAEAEAAQQALSAARVAGSKAVEARALHKLAERLLFGPAPSGEAVVEGEQLLEQAGGNLRVASKVRSMLSAVIAMRGEMDRAREMADEGIAILHDLGLASNEAMSRTLAATFIEMLDERYEVAEGVLRECYEAFDRLGAPLFAASVAGAIAEALAFLTRDDEADRWASLAAERAVAADYDAQVRWRRARARVLSHRGFGDAAIVVAQEAVEIANGTDDLLVQADASVALADVLIASGRPRAAAAALADALARYERKGNLISAERTARALAALPMSARDPAA